jgi:hypothetical protein
MTEKAISMINEWITLGKSMCALAGTIIVIIAFCYKHILKVLSHAYQTKQFLAPALLKFLAISIQFIAISSILLIISIVILTLKTKYYKGCKFDRKGNPFCNKCNICLDWDFGEYEYLDPTRRPYLSLSCRECKKFKTVYSNDPNDKLVKILKDNSPHII